MQFIINQINVNYNSMDLYIKLFNEKEKDLVSTVDEGMKENTYHMILLGV